MKLPWFVPEDRDVIGLLRAQASITIEGLEAFVAWSVSGGVGDADRVRALEHEADDRKRDVRTALTESFTTPLDAEDLYTMSERLDGVMTGAKNVVREAEVMGMPPDDHVSEMAEYLLEGVQRLDDAFSRLTKAGAKEHGPATEAADAAIKAQRQLERVYRDAASALIKVDDLRQVMGRRELYRRISRLSDEVIEVAERVWYATVKEG